MGVRDEEIKRLIKYSQGLGLPVRWVEHKAYSGSHAAAVVVGADGIPEYLELCTWKGQSKTTLILNLLHELGHHLSWIYKGRKDSAELMAAMLKDARGENLTKAERRVIYDMEKRDSSFRIYIYEEVGIKIPMWKLTVDIELDVWGYKYWWRTGTNATQEQFNNKKTELVERYKNAGKV